MTSVDLQRLRFAYTSDISGTTARTTENDRVNMAS